MTEPVDHHAVIVESIESVAPDAQVADLDIDVALADEVDLDSMDLLNIAAAIYERTGVDIPEREYTKFETLRDFIDSPRERSAVDRRERCGCVAPTNARPVPGRSGRGCVVRRSIVASASATAAIVRASASGVTLIESIPSRTRNAANSG